MLIISKFLSISACFEENKCVITEAGAVGEWSTRDVASRTHTQAVRCDAAMCVISGGGGMRPRPSHGAPIHLHTSAYAAPHQYIFYSFPIYHLDINIWFYSFCRSDRLLPSCISLTSCLVVLLRTFTLSYVSLARFKVVDYNF